MECQEASHCVQHRARINVISLGNATVEVMSVEILLTELGVDHPQADARDYSRDGGQRGSEEVQMQQTPHHKTACQSLLLLTQLLSSGNNMIRMRCKFDWSGPAWDPCQQHMDGSCSE